MSSGSKKNQSKIVKTPLQPKGLSSKPSLSLNDVFREDRLYFILIGALSFLLYIMSVGNGFALDDNLVTNEHPYVSKGIAGIPEILTNPYVRNEHHQMDYRPLAQISFAIERSLFGVSPGMNHLMNVLLYALLCVVLYFVLRLIFPSLPRSTIWLGSLLFAVHPLHSEVVNNLKSRDELFSLLFGLIFVWRAVAYYRSKTARNFTLSLLFLFLALFSKLSVLPILFFVVLYMVYAKKDSLFALKDWGFSVIYVLIWLIYIVAITKYFFPTIRTLTFTEFPLPDDPSLADRLGITIPTIFFYIKMMIVPYPLCSYYGYNTIPAVPVLDVKTLVVLAFFAVMAWLFFRGFKERKFSSLLPVWFIASGFLYYNIGYAYTGIVSERAAFITSIPGSLGIVMIIGLILDRKDISIVTPSKFVEYAVIAIAGIYGIISFSRVGDWKDSMTLYARDMEHYPNSGHLNFLQAVNYDILSRSAPDYSTERTYIDSAAFYFNRALVLEPDRPIALTYIGRYYIDYYNNWDTAEVLLNKAWNVWKNGETAYELGRVRTFLGKWAAAISVLEYARDNTPDIYWTWYFLAQAYFETGKTQEALAANEQLLKYPTMQEMYHLNAGNFLGRQGKIQEAIVHLRKAVELGNRDERALEFLHQYYISVGDNVSLQWLDELK